MLLLGSTTADGAQRTKMATVSPRQPLSDDDDIGLKVALKVGFGVYQQDLLNQPKTSSLAIP
jgi:hypothetical protein